MEAEIEVQIHSFKSCERVADEICVQRQRTLEEAISDVLTLIPTGILDPVLRKDAIRANKEQAAN